MRISSAPAMAISRRCSTVRSPYRVVLALALVEALVWLVALGSGTSGGVLDPSAHPGRGAQFSTIGRFLPAPAGSSGRLPAWRQSSSEAMRAPLHRRACSPVELTGDFAALPAE